MNREAMLPRRRIPALILGLILALPGLGHANEPAVASLDNTAPQRILFIGNSYLYYNDSLHNHVVRMVRERDPDNTGGYVFKSATIGGASLDQHAVPQLLEPGRLNVDEPFDVVVLQGGSADTLSDSRRSRFRETAIVHNETIRKAGAEVALYMTHAYVEPHRRASPTMTDRVRDSYVEVGNEIDALVIPVGVAFAEAYKRRPDIELHKSFDGSHPSMLGTYLAACVVYATLYQQPAVDIRYDYFGAVANEDAAFLRRVADDTVAGFFNRTVNSSPEAPTIQR